MFAGTDPTGPIWSVEALERAENHTLHSLFTSDQTVAQRVMNIICWTPLPTDSDELRWLRMFLQKEDEVSSTMEDLRKAVHCTRLIAAGNITSPSYQNPVLKAGSWVPMEAELTDEERSRLTTEELAFIRRTHREAGMPTSIVEETGWLPRAARN